MRSLFRRRLLPAILLLSTSPAAAQFFMRAYGPLGTIFHPPNYYASSFDAAVSPTGYVLTLYTGSVCLLDQSGIPQTSATFQRSTAPTAGNMYLTDVEVEGSANFYHMQLGLDTLTVVKTNAGTNIGWQAAMLGASESGRLLPTSDGGCAFLHSVGPSTGLRAAIVRYTANGSVAWRKAYRIEGNSGSFTATAIASTTDGGFLIAGKYFSGTEQKPYVCRISTTGIVQWAREIAPANGGQSACLALTELPNGNVRVAIQYPQVGMTLSLADLSSSGGFIGSWGYQGAGFSAASLRFGTDGSAYGVGGNASLVFRLAPDGSPVFAVQQNGPVGTNMVTQKLTPTPDGNQVMLGNYTTNPFSNSIPALYKSGPLGVLPPPYGGASSLTMATYTATVSTLSPSDSTFTGGFDPQLELVSESLLTDTLFETPSSIADTRTLHPLLELLPNPAHDILEVRWPATLNNGTLMVHDARGRTVMQHRTNSAGAMRLDVRLLTVGAYTLNLSGNGYHTTSHFIKQ